jgi:hypothetical protein
MVYFAGAPLKVQLLVVLVCRWSATLSLLYMLILSRVPTLQFNNYNEIQQQLQQVLTQVLE